MQHKSFPEVASCIHQNALAHALTRLHSGSLVNKMAVLTFYRVLSHQGWMESFYQIQYYALFKQSRICDCFLQQSFL